MSKGECSRDIAEKPMFQRFMLVTPMPSKSRRNTEEAEGSQPVMALRNLGPRCAEWLAQIGIATAEDLRRVGAATAYRELVCQGIVRPHRMLLYALGGAVLDMDCPKLTRCQKRELEAEVGL